MKSTINYEGMMIQSDLLIYENKKTKCYLKKR